MTALEAEALGVRIVIANGRPRMHAPPDAVDTVERVRAEVARRVGAGAMAVLARITSRVGECVTCGDAMSRFKGGMCSLCLAASAKMDEAKRKAP